MGDANETGRLDRGDGVELAWQRQSGREKTGRGTVVFLPGFGSDMAGSKAEALAAWCGAEGHGLLRFDYSGHGRSGGAFADGTIGRWCADALAAIDRLTTGRLVLAGSSMGGWIALLAALARPGRIAGLVGVAAAPDFTEDLIWEPASAEDRALLLERGRFERPDATGQPITRALIEDGRHHLLLRGPIALAGIPVRLLHGQADAAVPWQTALRLAERLAGADVQVTLVKDGDHRLSRPRDLALLLGVVASLLGEDAGEALAVGGV